VENLAATGIRSPDRPAVAIRYTDWAIPALSKPPGSLQNSILPYILESNPHPNLIRLRFCRFLKRKKKLVHGSNPHISFNPPLPTRQTVWIILDVTNAVTFIRLTRRLWSAYLRNCQRYKRTAADKRWGGVRWVSAAWKDIPQSIIVRSFTKCCISNALGGSEDDILWEDDGEDKRILYNILYNII
jgi:hypothetical protein